MIQSCDRPGERVALGAWALGALDPAERARVDEHLAGCPECGEEAASLAAVTSLLGRLSPAEAIAIGTESQDGAAGNRPFAPLAPVTGLAPARQRRRPWRALAMAAAAAAVIAVAVLGGTRLNRLPPPAPAAGQAGQQYGTPAGAWLTASSAPGSTSAVVMYRQMGWGTMLQAKVTGIPAGTRCQLTIVTSAGQRVTAAGWITDASEGRVLYPGSAPVTAAGIREFVITVAGRPAIDVPA